MEEVTQAFNRPKITLQRLTAIGQERLDLDHRWSALHSSLLSQHKNAFDKENNLFEYIDYLEEELQAMEKQTSLLLCNN